jgi:hypothetical protein
MRTSLHQALARLWARAVWGRRVLSHIVARNARSRQNSRSDEARARFWAELREGQREAEAQCSRPHL